MLRHILEPRQSFLEAGYALGLGIPANTFTGFLLISAIVFGIFISISGFYADKIGRRKWLIWVTIAIGVLGLAMPLFLENGTPVSVFAFLVIGMAIMGMTFGPMAALLPHYSQQKSVIQVPLLRII